MCGILGLIKNSNDEINVDYAFNTLKHRGPDSSGLYQDDHVILGTHRLKIQDLSNLGDQPIIDDTGRYYIIFNGEIYNNQAIRKKLIDQGVKFKGNSDTEAVLYGYIIYGEAILNLLNGIFALAIYDKIEQTIFGARDQFGVKPYYYYLKGNAFAFSSEIKALIHLPDFDNALNFKALANYMNYLWSPGELTPFKFMHKLLPGECFKIQVTKPATFKKYKYYDIPFNGSREFYSDKMWIKTIDEKLEQAVKSQLLSDVPVGFFLSGGIDSSLIVAAAAKLNKGSKLDCFTIKGDNNANNEGFDEDFKFAQEAAKHLNVNLHVVDGSINIINDFDKMIWHMDEPQADIAPLYVYKVCQEAREQGIKVLLSGAGGDDIFSGYRRHTAINLDKYLKFTPSFVFPVLEKYLQNKDVNNPNIRRINKFIKRNKATTIDRLVGYFEWYPIAENLNLFHSDIQNEIINYKPDEYLYNLLDCVQEEDDLLNKMLYLEQKTFLVDHNLNYTDKMGMAAGVEIRVPFLDIELVHASTRLPKNLKIRNHHTKYILRKIAAQNLPASIVNRAKTGFGAPVRKWISNDLGNMINERLSITELNKFQIFNPKAVEKLIDDNKKGKIDGAYTILTIMAVQSWLNQFYTNDINNN